MTATRRWVLLTALACCAVLAAGWLLMVEPRRSEAAALSDEVTSSAEATARLRTQLADLTAQAEDLPAQRARLAEIAGRLPDNPALPSLVRQLTALAERSEVVLVSLAPLTPTVLVDPAAEAAAAAAAALPPSPDATAPVAAPVVPAGLPLAALGLGLQVVGDYYQVQAFVDGLEELDRAFLVTGFSLAPGEAPGPSDESLPTTDYTGNLRLDLTGRVFLSPPTAAAPGAVTTLPGGVAPAPVVAAAPAPAAPAPAEATPAGQAPAGPAAAPPAAPAAAAPATAPTEEPQP